MPCPIARSLERVGEWWSILILREAFYGLTRFDEFQKTLAIAPNILTRRLNDADVYFFFNESAKPLQRSVTLKTTGKTAESWDAQTGSITELVGQTGSIAKYRRWSHPWHRSRRPTRTTRRTQCTARGVRRAATARKPWHAA